MIVAVQWTLSTPKDWVDLDLNTKAGAARWSALAKKPVPQGGEVLDNNPGWIFDLCIQGVHVYGFDHVAVEPIANDGVRAYGWSDDVDDTDPQVTPYRWGEVWEFLPPGPHPMLGGPVNTRLKKTVYTEVDDPQFYQSNGSLHTTPYGGWQSHPVEVRPWTEFPTPAEAITRHGIWVRDEVLWQRHFDVRARRDWREWTI